MSTTIHDIDGLSALTEILRPGNEPIDGYRLVKRLGIGGFAEVWQVEVEDGGHKALKVTPVESNIRELQAVERMMEISHPYLLSTEHFEVVDGILYVVMETAEGSLYDEFLHYRKLNLPGLPRQKLLRYLGEVAEALDALCGIHGLQHLDVKPRNVLMAGGHAKIADFGMVQPSGAVTNQAALAMTPPYAPTELFEGKVHSTADQYSLAITYQEMLCGSRPYNGRGVRQVLIDRLKNQPDLGPLPPSDRAIVAQAISNDPELRFPSCTAFIEALRESVTFGIPTAVPVSTSVSTTAAEATVDVCDNHSEEYTRTRLAEVRLDGDVDGDVDSPIVKRDLVTTPTNATVTLGAFIPLPVYAAKLRGFIDSTDAQIDHAEGNRVVLRFTSRHWRGLRSPRSMMMSLETGLQGADSTGYQLVEVNIWSPKARYNDDDFSHISVLLAHLLKGHLMAC